jgi:cellulose biosynthesis protein BcsQ
MPLPKSFRIVVGSAKGGVGKTTLAAHLAAHLSAVLVDLDPEGSTRAMQDHGLTIRHDAPPTSPKERVVLDVPANTASSAARLTRAVQGATHLIIPTRPGDIELDRLENTLAALVGHVNPYSKVGVVLNFARQNAITRETRDALEFLRDQSPVPFDLIGELPERVAFQRSLVNGFKGTLPLLDPIVEWL